MRISDLAILAFFVLVTLFVVPVTDHLDRIEQQADARIANLNKIGR